MKGSIVKLRHYGLPFLSNEHAVLLVIGVYHYYVLII